MIETLPLRIGPLRTRLPQPVTAVPRSTVPRVLIRNLAWTEAADLAGLSVFIPSLVAVLGFFARGLAATCFILPLCLRDYDDSIGRRVSGVRRGKHGTARRQPVFLAVYLLLGIAFGVVLTRSEGLCWFRIQEMFRFQSFRGYASSAPPLRRRRCRRG